MKNRKTNGKERLRRIKEQWQMERQKRRYSKEGLVEAVKTVGGFAKALFRPDMPYGIYLRNGCGFLALGWTANYCGEPFVYASFPIFALGAYNFIQAFVHKDEVPAKYLEDFKIRYREGRAKRREARLLRNRDEHRG